MPFDSLLRAAKANTPVKRQGNTASMSNFIDASVKEPEQAADPEAWKKCKALKQVNERDFCTQFFSLCRKDKCSTKFMKF
ncbi:hypothetical protein HZB89_02480 [archaeon]|nr:hypothetical protein [archaeon]